MNLNLVKKALLTDSGKTMVYNFLCSQHKKGVIAFIIQQPGIFALEYIDGVYVVFAERFIHDFVGDLVFSQIKDKIDFKSLDAAKISEIFTADMVAVKYSVDGTAEIIDANGQKTTKTKEETKQIFLKFIENLFDGMK